MFVTERRNRILELVNGQGSIRVSDLSKALNVTTETIRRDLLYLSAEGLVEKKFGGAVAVNESKERPITERKAENIEEKRAIARAALPYISGNNVIFIDASSTLIALAELLPSDLDLTIVTNSFDVIPFVLRTNSVVYFLGGEISGVTMSTSGFWTSQALESIKIDVAFLGTSGFQSHSGPTSKQFSHAHVKQKVIENSAQTIVLADSTKFVSNAVLQFASWSDIDLFITDSGAPQILLDAVKKQVEVITVEKG